MIFTSVALLLLRLATGPLDASEPPRLPIVAVSKPALVGPPSLGDWPKYCANLEMTGVAAWESAITKSTVSGLSLLWYAQLSGSVASSPTVVSGTVYIGDWGGEEWALDADSGNVKVSVNLGKTIAPQCTPPNLGITSAPAVSQGVLYLAGGDDAFYALDAQTLSVLWRTRLGDNSPQGGYYGWCSPAVVGEQVIQGVSSDCDDPFPPGAVAWLDAQSGTIVQETFTVPQTDPGGGVWTSPAVDLEAGKIFVTTASATHFDDGYAYSVVRLSLADLSIEDYWTIPNDPDVDSDWGSSPTLFLDAAGRRMFGAGQKNGGYYAFLRGDLAAGPVWVAPLAVGGSCPQCGNGVLSTAAFDGHRLYVGTGATPDGSGTLGSVVALDPSTGKILWRQIFPDGPVIAPISIANGVVFAAGGQTAAALDADTGQVLWHFNSPSGFYGGIAISRGRVYFGDLAGRFFAFGFP